MKTFLRPTLLKILVAKLLGVGLLVADFLSGSSLLGGLSMSSTVALVLLGYLAACALVHAYEKHTASHASRAG